MAYALAVTMSAERSERALLTHMVGKLS